MHYILDVSGHRKIKHRPLRTRKIPYSKYSHIIVVNAGLALERVPPMAASIRRTENVYELVFKDPMPEDHIRDLATSLDAISYITA